MAGNKVNTKGKIKDDKSKKSLIATNEDLEANDFSLLRKPVHTSVTGFGQARRIFDLATEELKTLLSDECDLLYECKVCRNIFRSLANFISHKRVYCKEKFNSSKHGHFIKSVSTDNEINKIRATEEGYQESLKDNGTEKIDADEDDERIPLTKDLTTIVEKLAKNKGAQLNGEDLHISLQTIPNSSVAVFQSVENGNENTNDNMRNQVNEIEDITSRNVAVLQSDGNFTVQNGVEDEVIENVIQISDDEDCDTAELKCKLCDMQFATQKTLKFHMKYKHVESRLVFPCPDCLEIFSTSWSVYRHLFKVHRKTAAQIRRMRESIQAKAFRMNNPPAFYEKRRNNVKTHAAPKITEEERLDQENQAWLENMEGDNEVPRCGGCGRTFERRAALAAHTHTCPPRSRALARRAPADARRIEIQIRKDYNKAPTNTLPLALSLHATETKSTKEESSEAVKKPKEPEKEKAPETEVKNPEPEVKSPEPEVKSPEPEVISPETEVNSIEVNTTESETQQKEDNASNDAEAVEKVNDNPLSESLRSEWYKLPYAYTAEKSNLLALRRKILPTVTLESFTCNYKNCNTSHTNMYELYRHVGGHYKWMRYACKLCNFKHYDFLKLPEHVKFVHKLKGDKDFYCSTVKAIDGGEALDLAEPSEEVIETAEVSPDSRRPSRCSSDSSRLSDDSSSSSTRVEGTRKRKVQQNKGYARRKRQKEDESESNDATTTVKTSEDNSSDVDEIYERTDKRAKTDYSSVASRRPVRKKAKPKNEDFEYDLSNLLKLEAQGYRDSQSTTSTKTTQSRKKPVNESPSHYEMLIKDCCGSLVTLSRKAVEFAKAHMKTSIAFSTSQDQPNVFVRPMLPKGSSRGDKSSPKKDFTDDKKDNPTNTTDVVQDTSIAKNNTKITINVTSETNSSNNKKDTPKPNIEAKKPQNINCSVPAPLLPIKFRRQSLEVMKNPIINKNIKDFTTSGMKTKILVIKPINRNKDGTQSVNTPLKFQTIKLKDGNKNSNGGETSLVVKVPKVDCSLNRPLTDSATLTSEKTSVNNETKTNDEVEETNNLCNGKPDSTDTQRTKAANEQSKTKNADELSTTATINGSNL